METPGEMYICDADFSETKEVACGFRDQLQIHSYPHTPHVCQPQAESEPSKMAERKSDA